MNYIRIIFSLIALLAYQSAISEEQQQTPEQKQYYEKAKKIWNSLDRQKGEINLPNKVATLKVPDSFYYLNPQDSEKILVEAWGNPPGAGKNTLGMLFPDKATPFDDGSWGVTIEYEEDGYVSDDNADEINYEDMLIQMKEDTDEASKSRVKQGYPPIELVGWAAKPFYDAKSHKLYWAKEIKFGDSPTNTLNYNIRVLGRKGVLILNFIAGMEQKQVIDSNINTVLALAEFNQGSRYEDFNPSIDEVAAYGIGALIAGKLIAKTGFLVVALLFLKKFAVIFIIAIGVFLKRFFSRKATSEQ